MTTNKAQANLLDVITAGRQLPDDCSQWALISVTPDLRPFGSTQALPWPGSWAVAPEPEPDTRDHSLDCEECCADCCSNEDCTANDDPEPPGFEVARSWQGLTPHRGPGGYRMGTPPFALLLIAHSDADLLGPYDDFWAVGRVGRLFSVDVIDGIRLIREHGAGADLSNAFLPGARLNHTDLTGANLRGTELSNATLYYTDFTGADMYRAGLDHTSLSNAQLAGVDLSWSRLDHADLSDANLRGANLHRATLRYSRLTNTDLRGASLTDVDFTGIDLTTTYLEGARAYSSTVWPTGFDPRAAGVVVS
ncbi:hypothetical protein GCM10010329_63340 [Streptomyces spiroverticillatus]|nr:hypothetical protein GCM10010329_63340 [Streptomyces spiroverticillatus]